MTTNEEAFSKLKELMVELFELPEEDIVPGALLIEDLGLDSIDAVDISVRIQELTGKEVEEEKLRAVRTVGDTASLLQSMLDGA